LNEGNEFFRSAKWVKHIMAGKKSEQETSSLSSSELPQPPDGGWGWAVVFASFMIHVVGEIENTSLLWSICSKANKTLTRFC